MAPARVRTTDRSHTKRHASIEDSLDEARATLDAFRRDPARVESVRAFVDVALRTFRAGGTVFCCGNGGSLSQAMHFAEEWTGRFRRDRSALPATALCDPSVLTCIANDFGYEQVFARQIEAHGRRGDLLVTISTSGRSPNLLRAARAARKLEMRTVGLLGRGGGPLAAEVDVPILVAGSGSGADSDSDSGDGTSDRIQEVHLQILHAVIEAVERALFPEIYVEPRSESEAGPG